MQFFSVFKAVLAGASLLVLLNSDFGKNIFNFVAIMGRKRSRNQMHDQNLKGRADFDHDASPKAAKVPKFNTKNIR